AANAIDSCADLRATEHPDVRDGRVDRTRRRRDRAKAHRLRPRARLVCSQTPVPSCPKYGGGLLALAQRHTSPDCSATRDRRQLRTDKTSETRTAIIVAERPERRPKHQSSQQVRDFSAATRSFELDRRLLRSHIARVTHD